MEQRRTIVADVAQTAEDLLRVADTAMYKVKYEGKDGIHVARS